MMNVNNPPMTTAFTTTIGKPNNIHNSKLSSTASPEPTTQQTLTNMGLLSSFSVLTTSPSLPNTETTKTKSRLHNSNNAISRPQTCSFELKIKMESVGAQPEQDDDLDMCPARTRPIWPRELIPWWQPIQRQDKPPYSYATLIAYAILVSQDGRLLLSDIYQWISETYPYYSLDQRGWQNSIRHNLSLNKKWFYKVDRRPTQANPGKGCYWTLVPGTEEMFMENITQAGGQHRKHHDIGLTAELSRGYCNNVLAKQQQNSLGTPDIQKTTLPSSTPKLPKISTPSTLAPMYSTFRMTNTTMESIANDKNHCKKRTKLYHHVDNKHHSQFSVGSTTSSSKRARIDDGGGVKMQPGDVFTFGCDDSQSDCDSGVDVGNEYMDGKIKNNISSPAELMSTNEQTTLYNVLDRYLDQLPLPGEHNLDALHSNDTNGSHFYAASLSPPPMMSNAIGSLGLMNSCDIDPILGYPSQNYYSINDVYYGENGNIISDASMKGGYPDLLTSKFGPVEHMDESLQVIPTMTTTTKTTTHDDQWQQKQGSSLKKKVDSLLIHMNGGDFTGDEEMANAYLKFDDDQACISKPLLLEDTGTCETMDGSTSGYQFGDDYLSNPFITMCGLLQS